MNTPVSAFTEFNIEYVIFEYGLIVSPRSSFPLMYRHSYWCVDFPVAGVKTNPVPLLVYTFFCFKRFKPLHYLSLSSTHYFVYI